MMLENNNRQPMAMPTVMVGGGQRRRLFKEMFNVHGLSWSWSVMVVVE